MSKIFCKNLSKRIEINKLYSNNQVSYLKALELERIALEERKNRKKREIFLKKKLSTFQKNF